jgi:hypothetical protein
MIFFVERIAHGYLGAAAHAKAEAAKSPEQRYAERQARVQAVRETRNRLYNDRITKEAETLLASLNSLVPDSTVHYAVEQAKRALSTLVREVEKNPLHTVALREEV